MARWVYRKADGIISHKCQYPDATKTSDTYATVDLADDVLPDLDEDRIDPTTKELRAATTEEKDAIIQERLTRLIDDEGRREDILTMIAFVVRRDMGPATFDALTAAQKKALIIQQATVWKDIRATIKRADFT